MEGRSTFTFNSQDDEYIVRIKGRSYKWLWLLLLLLLPLLLLLSFDKDITVVTIDNKTKNIVTNVNVRMDYVDYSLIKTNPLRFFVADTIKLVGTTQNDGKFTFTDVNYTLYSVIFHFGHQSVLTASAQCISSDTSLVLFHTLQETIPYNLYLEKSRVDIDFVALDIDDREPLAGVEVEVIIEGEVKKLLTDPAGRVLIKGMETCGNVNLNGQLDGFVGDTIISDVATVLMGEHNRTLLLKPKNGVISFTVKDLENQQPIPDVTAKLILNGESLSVATNTNGVGKGFFEDVKSKYQFELELRRVSYFDTLTKRYKVSEFERLNDTSRVFRMRPQKNSLIFRNIDSLTNQPIEGVANEIFINSEVVATIYSNHQGCFTIGNIGDNDIVEIKSTHSNYKFKSVKKNGRDVNVNNQHKRDIKMLPKMLYATNPAPRRNCGVHFSGTLLSDVAVGGHISKIFEPDKFGEYVGKGRYISNQVAFPKAVQYTFDAIAVDKGTHLKIYSKPNFTGEVLLDVSGPYLINNGKWKTDSRISNFLTKTFVPELEAIFPPSCRHWSETNMNSWHFGSVVITCDD